MMGRRVHQQHAKQHDMARDATRLCVVDLKGRDGTNLILFNIEEAVQLLDSLAFPFSELFELT